MNSKLNQMYSTIAGRGLRLCAAAAAGLACLLPAGTLSASSIKTCRVQARVLKVFPHTAPKTAQRQSVRKIRILVEKSTFAGGHSMGRNCSLKGLKLNVDLRINPAHAQVLVKGALVNMKYRTVINHRRVNGRRRFVRFKSWNYLPPPNNNRPVPPRPR